MTSKHISSIAFVALAVFAVAAPVSVRADNESGMGSYTSYPSVGSYTSYGVGSYTSYPSTGSYTSYPDYGSYTSYADYGSYTSYPDYGSYTSYPSTGSYTSYADYGSYTSYPDYGSYTSYPDYGSYTSYADYGCTYGCGDYYQDDYYYDDSYYVDDYYYDDYYYDYGCSYGCGNYTYTPPPAPKAPVCTLNASDTSIEKGESVTLSWTTSNATSVSLTDSGSVSNNGSRTVNPTSTRTYTLTVYGNGGSTNCSKTITVTTHPQHHEPVCALSASDQTLDRGDSTELHWTSENATSANLSSFGSVQTGGNRSVSPSRTTTYTLTVYGEGGSDTCSTTVHVEEDEDDEEPWCKLDISDKRVEDGDRVTLEWDTRNATYASINQGIGRVDEDGGTERVEVDGDTTYRMTVRNNDGDEDTCSVSVRVDEDDLSSITFYGDSVNNPPTVYLSQLPYTGLEDISPETMAYWLLLIAGAGGIGYFFFTRSAFPVFAFAQAEGVEGQEVSEATDSATSEFVEALRNDASATALQSLRDAAAEGSDVEEFLENARAEVADDEPVAARIDAALAEARLTGIRGAASVLA